MGQIVSSAAKPKRCNANQLSQVPTPAAGEHILVSSDNSMNAAGQGNFDCYIVGNGRTAATALPLIKTNADVVEQINQLSQKVWNSSFVGKGDTLSAMHQLDGMRRSGHYRLYLPVTNWDLTGVSAGSRILQIFSYGTLNYSVLDVYKEDTVLPYYDFHVPEDNDRIDIGGRAADGVVVNYYVVDVSYLDIARRSDVLGLDCSPWIYDKKINRSNGKIVTYKGMCLSSPIQLKTGDKISIFSGGTDVNLVSKTDASGAYISSLLSFVYTDLPRRLRKAEYTMTEDAFVRICYTYGFPGSYYEINGIRADTTKLLDELDIINNGNVPIDYIVNMGAVATNGSITSAGTYRYSAPIILKPGWTIAVESKGYNFAPISKTDSIGTTPFTPIVTVTSGDTTTLHKYTYTNMSGIIEYIVCCWRYEDGQTPVYFDDGFSKVAELSVSLQTNKIPDRIVLASTSYVSTARNYILKNEDVNGVDTLLYSKDCGETWASTPNTIGDIVFVHWFADGTCLIAGNHAVYTTKDGLTFTQSTILDENGASFTPSYNAFYRLGNYDSPYYEVDGKEVLIWNDYGISTGYVSRIWYSEDNGATIRCICAVNITRDINDVVINPRHFHRTFVDKNGVLWITSGDAGAECMLIRGTYSNGAWSFEILASGNEWKFGQFWINGPYAYAVTDYTNGDRPTGIIRWPLSKIADSTYFEYVATIPNESPVSSYFEDNVGVKIILPDGIGYKKFYMAQNNYDFKQVNIEMADNVAPMVLIGPNYKGECIVNGIAGYSTTQPLRLNYRRYMLSDGLRNAGVLSFAVVQNLI